MSENFLVVDPEENQMLIKGAALCAFPFDEPLSNLYAVLRPRTPVELSELHQRMRSTMIYVTHDQTEAMTLATGSLC